MSAKLLNELGLIEIDSDVIAKIAGFEATKCYGVVGMVRKGTRKGLRAMLSRQAMVEDGIRVRNEGERLVVDLHIEVVFGMNISAVAKSIVNKVRYTVEEATGLVVKKVNVFVDGIQPE